MTKQFQQQASFFDVSSNDTEVNASSFLSNSWLIAHHGLGNEGSSQSTQSASLDVQLLESAIGSGDLYFSGDSGEVISTVQDVLGISETGVMDASTVAAVKLFSRPIGFLWTELSVLKPWGPSSAPWPTEVSRL